MSSSLLLKESFDNLDQFNESFKLLLKNQNLKFKRKILSEKSKLLKKICEDKDLDFNVEFDRYIGDKFHKKDKKNKKNTLKDSEEESTSERILSKIEINKYTYWKDDETEILFDSKDFKKVGSYKDGNLSLFSCK